MPCLVSVAVIAVSCGLLGRLLPRIDSLSGSSIAWGDLPRSPLELETPVIASSLRAPARQIAAIPSGSDLATGPLPVNVVRLEEQIERRALANGTAGKPIRSATPGQQIAYPAGLSRNPDEITSPTHRPPVPVEARVRDYAYLSESDTTPLKEFPDTVLWHPALLTKAGQAEVQLTLPRPGATYRVLIQGHDATGRLGVMQTELRTAPLGAP